MKNRLKNRGFPIAELHLVQFGIKTALGQELVVGADLADLPFIEDDDLVGFADGGEPMGDDDRAAAGNQFVDGLLDQLFGFGIDGGGGLVQYQDGRIIQESTDKG